MWFLSSRRLRAELTAARAEANRLRDERDEALKQRETAEFNRKQILRQFTEADEKYVDTCLVNECLTADLTAAREKLAEFSGRRTVAEVLEEHDVHRKALADALGEQKRGLNWDQLIGETSRLAGLAADWMADHAKEKTRADEAEQRLDVANSRPTDSHWRAEARRERDRADGLQKRLDDAVGLTPGRPQDSAPWQPGYRDPRPGGEVSAS